MPHLEPSGARLYYEEAGAGEPILTTHGLAENATYWSLPGITDGLAKRFRVISMDMRGHGQSVVTGDPPGFDVGHMTAIEDANGLLRELLAFLDRVAA
jgi:pimeloyl-ACP methyl ester carboxylesterase